MEARERGWQAHTRLVEIGVRGFVVKSTTTLLYFDWILVFEDGHSKEL